MAGPVRAHTRRADGSAAPQENHTHKRLRISNGRISAARRPVHSARCTKPIPRSTPHPSLTTPAALSLPNVQRRAVSAVPSAPYPAPFALGAPSRAHVLIPHARPSVPPQEAIRALQLLKHTTSKRKNAQRAATLQQQDADHTSRRSAKRRPQTSGLPARAPASNQVALHGLVHPEFVRGMSVRAAREVLPPRHGASLSPPIKRTDATVMLQAAAHRCAFRPVPTTRARPLPCALRKSQSAIRRSRQEELNVLRDVPKRQKPL